MQGKAEPSMQGRVRCEMSVDFSWEAPHFGLDRLWLDGLGDVFSSKCFGRREDLGRRCVVLVFFIRGVRGRKRRVVWAMVLEARGRVDSVE